jgi:hypothetical protein
MLIQSFIHREKTLQECLWMLHTDLYLLLTALHTCSVFNIIDRYHYMGASGASRTEATMFELPLMSSTNTYTCFRASHIISHVSHILTYAPHSPARASYIFTHTQDILKYAPRALHSFTNGFTCSTHSYICSAQPCHEL